MSIEEEAFLAAIRAAPADDLTRLVYADWLDERGDPRGGMIRAEVTLGQAAVAAVASRPPEKRMWLRTVIARGRAALARSTRRQPVSPHQDPSFDIILAGLADGTEPPEPLIRLARGRSFVKTLDRDGAVAALRELPLVFEQGGSLHSARNCVTELRAAGGRVTVTVFTDSLTRLAATLEHPWADRARARAVFAAGWAAVVNAGGLLDERWWQAVRPHFTLTLHALRLVPPANPRPPRPASRYTLVTISRPGPYPDPDPVEKTWREFDRCAGFVASHFFTPPESGVRPDEAGRFPVVSRKLYTAEDALQVVSMFGDLEAVLSLHPAGPGESEGVMSASSRARRTGSGVAAPDPPGTWLRNRGGLPY